ncbi:hypothetical protein CGMCC3_g6850 [Colletotrichum fructicola]|nr:uncharacterized protein CGMCC3_g6850 [Colletotrichum fructicola]KAE9577164.1 hypothetical protein CGMCC3_g6850 [Colletotrichum fructicola]
MDSGSSQNPQRKKTSILFRFQSTQYAVLGHSIRTSPEAECSTRPTPPERGRGQADVGGGEIADCDGGRDGGNSGQLDYSFKLRPEEDE